MDRQAKFKSQTQNSFYGDNKARSIAAISGTAIRGTALELNTVFAENPTFRSVAFRNCANEDEILVDKIPNEVSIDISLMRLGKERYDIHCAICHGQYGNGQGFCLNSA